MGPIDSFTQFWVFFDARWWFGTVFTCLVGWYKLLMVFTLPERRNSSCNFCGFRVIGLLARSGRKLLARSCCNDYNGPGWCSRHLRIMWDRLPLQSICFWGSHRIMTLAMFGGCPRPRGIAGAYQHNQRFLEWTPAYEALHLRPTSIPRDFDWL